MATATLPARSTPPAAPRAVLDELVHEACSAAARQYGDLVARLTAALGDMTDPGIDPQQAYRRVKAGQLLQANSYAFIHLAGEALARALRAAVDELLPGARLDADPLTLSLVPLEVMDNRIAFGTLSRAFDIAHSEVLASLCVRLGQLLGRGLLRAGQNPFRPEVFLGAIHQAWCDFMPDALDHPLLAPLLRPDLFFDLAPLLEALDAALRARSKQARERFHISKTSDTGRPRQGGMDAALAQQLRSLLGDGRTDAAGALVPELPNMPQGNGWRPGATAGAAGAAPAAGAAGAAFALSPGSAGQASAVLGGAPGGASLAAFAPPSQQAGALAAGFLPVAAGMPGPAQAFLQAAPGSLPGSVTGSITGSLPGSAAGPGLAGGLAGGVALGPAAPALAGTAQPGSLLHMLASLPASVLGMSAPAALAASAAGVVSGPGAGPGPAAPGAALPSAAAALENVFYLPRLKQSLAPGTLSRGEENTLDLLSRIFETVLLDDSIPADTRELIRFLQVPVLKAALLDQEFFFEEAHPARRMIDLLSNMGWEGRQRGDDPVVQAMRRGVERIGRDSADAPAAPQAFAAAVADLEAQLALEEHAAEAAIADPVAQATRVERQTVAARSARQAVRMRVADGALVAVVSGFLSRRWVDVLTFAYLIEDERPGALKSATQAMDELVWTVKPKATQEQRRALIAKLPGLLSALNKWLDAIKWQDAERRQFFADLARCHLSIVRAPLELSPERQLELAVEAAQQDALRRIAQEAALAEETPAQDPAGARLDAFERGMRFEFSGADGSIRKLKLAWVSPLRTLFIFSGGLHQPAFSLAAEKLLAALAGGDVRVLTQEGVVGRVLSAAMQGANDGAALPA